MIKAFTETNSVSGSEKDIRLLIKAEAQKYADEIKTDAMGNLEVYKYSEKQDGNTKTVILSAHMDEVGLIITGITESGMLNFDTVGGIETSVLLSKKVKIGNISGVIGLKPLHSCTDDEREECPDIRSLCIDIGAESLCEAKKYVTVGDYCAFDSEYKEFGDGFAKAKAFDDRLGCIAILDALKEKYNCNLICLFNVQEETGLRGAKASIYGKKADYALVLECTSAGDVTNAKPHMTVTRLGAGAAISIMDSSSIADKALRKMLISVAERHKIKYQLKKAATGGNDAGIIHISNGGIRTCSISVPSRYIHSPSSVISLDDFECVKALLKAFLKDLQ